MTKRGMLLPGAIVLPLLMAAVGAAQEPQPGAGEAQRLTAHRLAQLARSVLLEREGAGPQRLAVAGTLLAEATGLDPSNAELWRLRIEAIELSGEADALPAALAGYLRAEPRDDAAQLELMRLLADEAQTVDDRVAAYRRLVTGPRAERLSGAARSIIALRAADLHRERGDSEGFAEMLKLAVSLEQTNREAHLEAYRLLRERGAERLARAQALLNLLAADPADGDAHGELARVLLRCGQYERSTAWFDSAARLWAYQGMPEPRRLRAIAGDWAMALWGAGRGEEAIAFIDTFLGDGLEAAPARRPEALGGAGDDEPGEPVEVPDPADGEPAQAEPTPDDAPEGEPADRAPRPVGLQSIVVAIHTTAGREQAAAEAFEKLIEPLVRRSEAQPDNSDLLADRAWAHLLFDRETDRVGPMVDRLGEMLDGEDPVLRRLRGWALLRAGRREEARRMLGPIAADDPVALFGLALLLEGDSEEVRRRRLEALNRVHADDAGGLIGLMAAHRVRRQGGRPRVSDDCQAIARLERQVPADVRELADNPYRLIMLRPRAARRIAYGRPVEVELELTNVSGTPLSLGPGGTIPGSAVILMAVTIDGEPGPDLPPHVVDLHRRLRLDAGRSLTVTTALDLGPLGELLHAEPTREVRIRAAAVLNPRLDADGRLRPGLLGVRAPMGEIERPAWRATTAAIESELAALTGEHAGAALAASARLARAAPTLADDQPELAEGLATAVHEAYTAAEPVERAWIVSHLPADERGDRLFARLLDEAVNSDEPLVQYALLASRARGADSPILHAALRREPGPIRDFARHLRDALREAEEPKK